MYGKYVYNPLGSVTNILNDIGLLLTGTTDKNLLSSDCDKVNSDIIATDAAGWTEVTGTELDTVGTLPSIGKVYSPTTYHISDATDGTNFIVTYTDYNANLYINKGLLYSNAFTSINSSFPLLSTYFITHYSKVLNTFFVFGKNNTNYYISTNTITWSNYTFPSSTLFTNSCDIGGLFLVTGGVKRKSFGTVSVINPTISSTYYTTIDGVNWIMRTAPYPLYEYVIKGNTLYYLSYGTADRLLKTIDGINWVTIDLPPYINGYGRIITDGTNLYHVYTGPNTQYRRNIYQSTDDGVTWQKVGIAPTGFSVFHYFVYYKGYFFCQVGTVTYCSFIPDFSSMQIFQYTYTAANWGMDWSGGYYPILDTDYFITWTSIGSFTFLNRFTSSCKTFKSLCADGITYKYLTVNVDATYISYFGCIIKNNTCFTLARPYYNSVSGDIFRNGYSQKTSGVLYIWSSNRKILFLSDNRDGTFGYNDVNYNNNPTGFIEYQYYNGKSLGYGTAGGTDFYQFYPPMIKTDKTDNYDISYNIPFTRIDKNSITKRALGENGLPVYVAGELTFYNSYFTYLSGMVKLLGNVYRFQDSIGSFGDTVTLNGLTYMVVKGNMPNANSRFLLPKF